MKYYLLAIITFISISGVSQVGFPVDTIKVFNLSLQKNIHLPVSTMETTIDSVGNVHFVYYISNFEKQKRDTIAEKRITLDQNTFRQIKEQISILRLDTLQPNYDDPYVSDGSSYYLNLNLNGKELKIRGQNRDYCDEAFKRLKLLLENVVGYFAVDYELY